MQTFPLLRLLTERPVFPLGFITKPQVKLERKCWLKLKKLVDIYKPLTCLEAQSKSSNSILIYNCDCTSRCECCLEEKEVCTTCKENGFQSIEPQLHPCGKCISDGKKCVKFVITSYSSDCEQKNKTALEIMHSRKEAEVEHRQSNLRLTEGTPDAVHVGKCLKGSLANWWLVLDNFRVNLVMLHTLRQDYKSETGRDLRQAITLESLETPR